MNIYVGNLPYKIRDEQLRDAFEEFGEVYSAEVIVDRRSNRSKGYGFVRMDTESEAQEAIDALHRSDFYGRELRVQPANTGERSSDSSKRRRRNQKRKQKQISKRIFDSDPFQKLLGDNDLQIFPYFRCIQIIVWFTCSPNLTPMPTSVNYQRFAINKGTSRTA